MAGPRLDLSTALAIAAVVSAAAFALGRSTSSSATSPAAAATAEPPRIAEGPPPGAPELPDDLPPGHPPVAGGMVAPGMAGGGMMGGAVDEPPAAQSSLEWKVPARWVVAPNTSSMRLATYRVPRAPSDAADGEISVMQAGGSVEANVTRWIGQFDGEAQKHARRSTKKVGTLAVTIVEVDGTYGGMGGDEGKRGWSLLGAIVETPGMPHFFKMTGPEKTVRAARAELDELVASLSTK